MLELASSPQTVVAPPSTHWTTRGAATRWLSAIIGALLALALGIATLQHMATEHSLSRTAPRHRLAPHQGPSSLPLTAQGVVSTTLGADDPPRTGSRRRVAASKHKAPHNACACASRAQGFRSTQATCRLV
jgi:hypothetical protein